jgi:hypothetical protein
MRLTLSVPSGMVACRNALDLRGEDTNFSIDIVFDRYESNSGGEREIQRTMLELLNQLDGFDARGEIKVIMATNRIETLDPALLRPGRIDRKIEFPLPDVKTKRMIFGIHTGKMTLADDVNLEEFIMAKDDLSGADIKVHVCPRIYCVFVCFRILNAPAFASCLFFSGYLHRSWSARSS